MKMKDISLHGFTRLLLFLTLVGGAMGIHTSSVAMVTPAHIPEQSLAAPRNDLPDQAGVEALPREQTLYLNGYQWAPAIGWNPYSDSMNNMLAITQGSNARVTVFETPYIYNMLTGEQIPLLADGPYTWNDELTEITFTIKTAAHWSDGTPVTAYDVAYTWETNILYQTTAGQNFQDYIDSITAVDAQTVLVEACVDPEGNAINPLMVASYLSDNYVIQKAWTQTLEARSGGDPDAFKNDPALDFIASGPYKLYNNTDQIIVLVRDENYWGQDASMWGKLPVPKYLAHVIYPDNDASLDAFKTGKVDISQMFIPNVQDLWLVEGLPVSTYLPVAPYHVAASLPTVYYNLDSYGLDNIVIRKAIAMAVDYNTIIANAMANQSPTFDQVPRSVMNPTPGEQVLYNQAEVEDLQWAGSDITGALALLDGANIIDTDNDGWRELGGQKLSYTAVCPNGWTDWQAAISEVAMAGSRIGIEITPLYPDWSEYMTIFTNGDQTEYDIFMVWSSGAGPNNPWARVRQLMSSEYANTQNNWNGNWGGYINPEIDAIIAAIPAITDTNSLVDLYTEATRIYLTDIPSFTVMYRPDQFHTVNETVWTNFPHDGDGLEIPPLNLINGYSIAGLYNLVLAKPHHVYLPTLTR